jgi:hypothetical protein
MLKLSKQKRLIINRKLGEDFNFPDVSPAYPRFAKPAVFWLYRRNFAHYFLKG